jgi:hypothetical protein
VKSKKAGGEYVRIAQYLFSLLIEREVIGIVSDLKKGGGEAIRVKGGSYTRK